MEKIERTRDPIQKKKLLSTTIFLLAFISLILSMFLGMRRENGNIEDKIQSLIPPGSKYRVVENNIFECFEAGNEKKITGYIANGEADGFAGPMEIGVLADTKGNIKDLAVLSNKETLPYYEKVIDKNFLHQIKNKTYADQFENGKDYDAVSGATYTSKGIAEAARKGVQKIAVEQLDLEVPLHVPPKIKFGIPEITLVLLYLIVLIGLQTGTRIKKAIRWITMLAGMFILGFWFTVPLSINKVNQFLLGYWPDWHINLYWYMLIFSVFGIILINKKRLYCNWFCPFGAAQDCMALIGGGKIRIPKKLSRIFIIIQRTLVWLVLLYALYYRTPSFLNYEIFSTFFALTGTSLMFGLMAIFIIASMFIKRPWCKILCPIEAISDFTSDIRDRIVNLSFHKK
ncbi:MAG: 4Fe-4S binding protein [Candidatus Aminicenantes bacterium]|nr:4Fe-4S binding protein [Candidatus Aminicenantes bacterium]